MEKRSKLEVVFTRKVNIYGPSCRPYPPRNDSKWSAQKPFATTVLQGMPKQTAQTLGSGSKLYRPQFLATCAESHLVGVISHSTTFSEKLKPSYSRNVY